MFKVLNSKLLLTYFNYFKLLSRLNTGLDRITSTKFDSIKDDEFKIILEKYNKLGSKRYSLAPFKESHVNNRVVYIPTIRDKLLLEFVKDKVKEKYKIKIPDRNKLINHISCILNEQVDYTIISLDIRHFFASINQKKLFNLLKSKYILQEKELFIVKQYLDKVEGGVPQGISLSNYLSEIYLEHFDLKIKHIHPNLIFYSRYVDDLLIIINGVQHVDVIYERVKKELVALDLEINTDKLVKTNFSKFNSTQKFNYLGYSFTKVNKKLIINICSSKMKNIYRKIDKCFYNFNNNRNFELLYDRLNMITSYNIIRKTSPKLNNKKNIKNIKFGLVENYNKASDEDFYKIDKYISYKLACYKNIINRDNDYKNKLYSLSIIKSRKLKKCLNYNKIPFTSLRSKVSSFYTDYNYSDIIKKSKQELLSLYFKKVRI